MSNSSFQGCVLRGLQVRSVRGQDPVAHSGRLHGALVDQGHGEWPGPGVLPRRGDHIVLCVMWLIVNLQSMKGMNFSNMFSNFDIILPGHQYFIVIALQDNLQQDLLILPPPSFRSIIDNFESLLCFPF